MKRFLLTAAAALAMTSVCYAADTVGVVVNDVPIDTDAVIESGRTLVPLRGVFEQLGYSVKWNAETKEAIFVNGDKYMTIDAKDGGVYIGAPHSSIAPPVKADTDVPAQLINDRLYLPLRAASEGLGLSVDWDGETKTVYVKDGEENVTTPDIDLTDLKADNSMAYKMNELMPKTENYMFSPLSIKMALALAANGADGETQAEIAKTAGLGDIQAYNVYAQNLIETYKAVSEKEEKQDDIRYLYDEPKHEKTQLSIANSIWLNKDKAGDITFKDEYIKAMKQFYDAEINNVGMADGADRINKWCSDKTNGKIPHIVDSSNFLAALVNAVYFKAEWAEQFDEFFTHEDTFTDRNGEKQTLDFMEQTEEFAYYEDKDIQMVKMPYVGGNTAMYIMLSGDKRVDFTPYINKTEYQKVHIKMPKFKVEYSVTLNDMLNKIGIQQAFVEGGADFTKMLQGGTNSFFIDTVLHKTYIDVDENGTEAAAVTAILVEATAAFEPEEPVIKDFIADKPFSYIIRDEDTGEILFMGEYAYKD